MTQVDLAELERLYRAACEANTAYETGLNMGRVLKAVPALLAELKAARAVIKKIYSAPSAHDCPACLAAESEMDAYAAAIGAQP